MFKKTMENSDGKIWKIWWLRNHLAWKNIRFNIKNTIYILKASILYTSSKLLLFMYYHYWGCLLNKRFLCFQSSLAPAVYRCSLLRPAVLRSFISDKPTSPCLAATAVLSDVAI